MPNLLQALPKDQALFLFVLCLLVGAFVIYKFCLDQFDKPGANNDENDPWKFVVPRFQTPPRQYLIGFSVYFGALTLIFLVISIIGPGPFFEILKALMAAATQTDMPATTPNTVVTLQQYPTFPILVAFYIVGLNPNLPKALDFEIGIRTFALRIAYIPKNMDQIFNYMRFSEFNMPDDKLEEAWSAIELRRLALDAPDLKSVMPVFNRAVLLFAQAATLAGDLNFDDAKDLQQDLSLDVFKEYRSQIQNVGTNLQAIHARISELGDASAGDRRRIILGAQRDLIKNVELLYVIFACATTVKGIERIPDRLRAIGFTSPYPLQEEIPWNPILNVIGAAAVVLFLACLIAAKTFLGKKGLTQIPNDATTIIQQLMIILIVHSWAIAQALKLRTRLMTREEYFSEAGTGDALANIKIFAKCWMVSLLLYLLLYGPNLVSVLGPPDPAQNPGSNPQSSAELLWGLYVYPWIVWSIVPACCGVMTAFTLDRASTTRLEQATSGMLEGAVMAGAALLVLELTQIASPEYRTASTEYRVYYFVLYGGLGFVLGFLLPAAIRRFWSARETRLPDKISVLRTAVLQYFHDIQQFSEWLHARNARLDGKRPLDILTEESGLQRLTSFVTETRSRISPVAA